MSSHINGNYIPMRQFVQVVQATVTSATSIAITAGTYSDWTDLTLTITPTSLDSTIRIMANLAGAPGTTGNMLPIRVMRDATPIYIGTDIAASQLAATAIGFNSGNFAGVENFNICIDDHPNTISAVTYKIQLAGSTQTMYLQRSGTDTNSSACCRLVSNIIAIEEL